MRDDEWQAAYNAGRESVAGLVEALEVIAETYHQELNQSGWRVTKYNPSDTARTALEKYREEK